MVVPVLQKQERNQSSLNYLTMPSTENKWSE